MREQNIEKLFKDTFSNFEADVNPSAWANIEQGLPSAPQNMPGNSPVAKPAGFFSKVSLNTVILVTAISAALIGTTMYLSSQKPGQDTLAQAAIAQSEPQVAQNNPAIHSQPAPVVSQSAPAVVNVPGNEPKNAAQKQSSNQPEEKVNVVAPSQQALTPAETKTETAPNPNPNSNGLYVETNPLEPAGIDKGQQVTGKPENGSHPDVTQSNPDPGKVHSTNLNHVEQPANAPDDIFTEAGPAMEIENEEQFRFYMPNVFTPNSDMMNDFYKPVVNTNLKDYEMTIYDRYGFEIFKSKDINDGWDGKLKDGNIAATAVYVCIIKLVDFNDEEHNYIKGFLLFK